MLFGRYSDEASSLESNSILRKYREVIDIYNDWEEGHFYLAQYYDKIMTTLFEENTAKGYSICYAFYLEMFSTFQSVNLLVLRIHYYSLNTNSCWFRCYQEPKFQCQINNSLYIGMYVDFGNRKIKYPRKESFPRSTKNKWIHSFYF